MWGMACRDQPDSNIPTLIEYGRVFENMLLKIRERMIAIHPMTQMLEEEPWKNKIAKEMGLDGRSAMDPENRISEILP